MTPAIHVIIFATENSLIDAKIQLLLQKTVFTGPSLQVISFGLLFLTQIVLNPNFKGKLKLALDE